MADHLDAADDAMLILRLVALAPRPYLRYTLDIIIQSGTGIAPRFCPADFDACMKAARN